MVSKESGDDDGDDVVIEVNSIGFKETNKGQCLRDK
jgi:hypothetical protein